MLQTLSDHEVEYVVVGAVALAAHGIPRATADIDIWVNTTSENADKVYRALAAFGAPLGDLTRENLAMPGIFFQIGVPPLRIDILTCVDGVTFQEAWADKITIDFDGVDMPILSKRLMQKNKRALNRPKDKLDVEALRKSEGGR